MILVDALWDELMEPYKATGWYWLMEPVSMIVRASLSGFLLTDICLPGARTSRQRPRQVPRMTRKPEAKVVPQMAPARWNGVGRPPLGSIAPQALVISDGCRSSRPQSTTVVQSTFWSASTIPLRDASLS